MAVKTQLAAKFLALLFMSLALFTIDVTTAHAQSANCAQLLRSLNTFDRNGDFRNGQDNVNAARQLAAQLQDLESQYVRGGCNDDAKAGRPLTRECRGLAREILRGRADKEKLDGSVQTGVAIAQQREAILQEISRFGCQVNNSQVTFSNGNDQASRGNLFDQLFGNFRDDGGFIDGDIVGDQFTGYGSYRTIRTVCVRLSDGYFWPISYSTLPEYAGNDAQQCSTQCPGTPVELYMYDNPGQEPEQMVSINGQPYSSLPTAFRYREAIDETSTCKAPSNEGSIQMLASDNGTSRAIVEFNGNSFPLPLRDPRRRLPTQTITAPPVEVVASAADQIVEATADVVTGIPLPRRRPVQDGEVPVQEIAGPQDAGPIRLVQFGEKVVRIVGPDTPYAQPAAAGG